MSTLYFTPPTRQLTRAGGGRLLGRFIIAHGVTLLIHGEDVTERVTPTQDEIDGADYAYRGGYIYEIDSEHPAHDILVAAGYGAYFTLAGDIEGDVFYDVFYDTF